jgi:hypothetical protein
MRYRSARVGVMGSFSSLFHEKIHIAHLERNFHYRLHFQVPHSITSSLEPCPAKDTFFPCSRLHRSLSYLRTNSLKYWFSYRAVLSTSTTIVKYHGERIQIIQNIAMKALKSHTLPTPSNNGIETLCITRHLRQNAQAIKWYRTNKKRTFKQFHITVLHLQYIVSPVMLVWKKNRYTSRKLAYARPSCYA